MKIKSNLLIVLFMFSISLLNFYLLIQSVTEKEALKSLNVVG